MVRVDNPYIFFNPDDIMQLLADEEVWKNLEAAQLTPEDVRDLRARLVEAIAESCERATELPVNQAGEPAALAGQYNFVLHKFSPGPLRLHAGGRGHRQQLSAGSI
jgi:hypothetical protein